MPLLSPPAISSILCGAAPTTAPCSTALFASPFPLWCKGAIRNPVIGPFPLGQLGTGSFVDPDNGQARMIPLEIKFRSEPQPRYSRVSTNPAELDGLELTHERGAVAMARSQAPDSASAQFYVALRPLPELDGRYAVFGRVVDGMEVVDAIQQGDRITKAAITQ